MPESSPKGGRPRLYASQSEVDSLIGRVSALECRPAGAPAPASAPDDRSFVENAMVALVTSGTFRGGDEDLAPMSSVVTALLVTRDLILTNAGIEKERRIEHLRREGYLRHFGIQPNAERAAS